MKRNGYVDVIFGKLFQKKLWVKNMSEEEQK